MYDPTIVANNLLEAMRKRGRTCTPLQLIKLLYVAHGFSLALLGKPLINEPVEAWRYGPVIKSVYRRAKVFGRGAVTSDLPTGFILGPKEVSPEVSQLVDAVAERWGHLSGAALSNWTHLPDSPWHQVYNDSGENALIPNDLIANSFTEFVRRNKAKQDAGERPAS